jgi:hypothetical protein
MSRLAWRWQSRRVRLPDFDLRPCDRLASFVHDDSGDNDALVFVGQASVINRRNFALLPTRPLFWSDGNRSHAPDVSIAGSTDGQANCEYHHDKLAFAREHALCFLRQCQSLRRQTAGRERLSGNDADRRFDSVDNEGDGQRRSGRVFTQHRHQGSGRQRNAAPSQLFAQ